MPLRAAISIHLVDVDQEKVEWGPARCGLVAIRSCPRSSSIRGLASSGKLARASLHQGLTTEVLGRLPLASVHAHPERFEGYDAPIRGNLIFVSMRPDEPTLITRGDILYGR